MKVTVTQQDIEEGYPRSDRACPVALAAGRVLQDCYSIRVHHSEMWLYGSKCKWRKVCLPPWVTSWLIAYDDGQAVKPMSFKLGNPEPEDDSYGMNNPRGGICQRPQRTGFSVPGAERA